MQGGGVTKWGRTSQRTSTYKPRDISNATGGTMTTRTGEPATKKESYTNYLQGRAGQVRKHSPQSSFNPDPISRGCKLINLLRTPLLCFACLARVERFD